MNKNKLSMGNTQKSIDDMTDDEIKSIRDSARLELMRRGLHDNFYESGALKPNIKIIHTANGTMQ